MHAQDVFKAQLAVAPIIDKSLLNDLIETRRELGWSDDRLEEFKTPVILGQTKMLFFLLELTQSENSKQETVVKVQSIWNHELDDFDSKYQFMMDVIPTNPLEMPRYKARS